MSCNQTAQLKDFRQGRTLYHINYGTIEKVFITKLEKYRLVGCSCEPRAYFRVLETSDRCSYRTESLQDAFLSDAGVTQKYRDGRISTFYRTRPAAERALIRYKAYLEMQDAQSAANPWEWYDDPWGDRYDAEDEAQEKEFLRVSAERNTAAIIAAGSTSYIWQIPLPTPYSQVPFIFFVGETMFYAFALPDHLIRIDYKAVHGAFTSEFTEPRYLRRVEGHYVEPRHANDWHAPKFPKDAKYNLVPQEWRNVLEQRVLFEDKSKSTDPDEVVPVEDE